VYELVNPSVVNINVAGQLSGGNDFLPEDHPEFFAQGLGSGFVWDTEGHIVTNNHVVANAELIEVSFSDGVSIPAEIVGTDPDSDLAVLKVDMPEDRLRPVQVTDTDSVNVGQLAIAIGNPFGLDGTMTVGIVSAIGRSLPVGVGLSTYSIPDIIQTDAPINPGNSGGVLVDAEGRLIGVTTAIESPVEANAGIGFAVPSDIVSKVVPALIDRGSYQHPWLGIMGRTLNPAQAEAMGLDSNQRGALVVGLVEGGPSEQAGLMPSQNTTTIRGIEVEVGGDVIIAIDGEPVNGIDEVISYLSRNTEVGQTITLTVLRDGDETGVEVTLGARPSQSEQLLEENQAPLIPLATPEPAGGLWIGIQGGTITPEFAEAAGLPAGTQGVIIESIVPEGPADEAGLRSGDIITAMDGRTVETIEELRDSIQAGEDGQEVTLTVLRNGEEIEIQAVLETAP
jgi:S1-C subfamily serine protease